MNDLLASPGTIAGREGTRPIVLQADHRPVASPTPLGGELLRAPFFLGVPSQLLKAMPLPNPKPRWFVDAGQAGPALDRFAQLGAPEALINALLQSANRAHFGNFVVFFPPPADVVALDPAVRVAIYEELRQYPQNDEMVYPFVFSGAEDVLGWFAGTGLRPEIIRLIERLAYPRGDALAFSDASLVVGQTRGEAEARQVMAALHRTRTLLLEVAIPSGSDADLIAASWKDGPAERDHEVSSLIASWCDNGMDGVFDATHLLPKIPRMLLFTFPNLSMTLDGGLPDCHWTTHNFFNARPLSPISDPAALIAGLAPVASPYRFGDVLIFWSERLQKVVHSCIHIAEGIVFTKNSAKPTSPWVLQEWDDVWRIHLGEPQDRVQGYRPSDGSAR